MGKVQNRISAPELINRVKKNSSTKLILLEHKWTL
jgi:hypothetical protein